MGMHRCPHCGEVFKETEILRHRLESRRKAKIIASCILQNTFAGDYKGIYQDDDVLRELKTTRDELEDIMAMFESTVGDINEFCDWDTIIAMIIDRVKEKFSTCNM